MISGPSIQELTRHFTVAVFVVCRERVLLHEHPKLGIWLPPGGHIEPNELPDDAAIREVAEETGFSVTLVGERGLPLAADGEPVQLVVPAGIQLEPIGPGHEHIDLVYFAEVTETHAGKIPGPSEGFFWFRLDELAAIPVSAEVRGWCTRAIREVAC